MKLLPLLPYPQFDVYRTEGGKIRPLLITKMNQSLSPMGNWKQFREKSKLQIFLWYEFAWPFLEVKFKGALAGFDKAMMQQAFTLWFPLLFLAVSPAHTPGIVYRTFSAPVPSVERPVDSPRSSRRQWLKGSHVNPVTFLSPAAIPNSKVSKTEVACGSEYLSPFSLCMFARRVWGKSQ